MFQKTRGSPFSLEHGQEQDKFPGIQAWDCSSLMTNSMLLSTGGIKQRFFFPIATREIYSFTQGHVGILILLLNAFIEQRDIRVKVN